MRMKSARIALDPGPPPNSATLVVIAASGQGMKVTTKGMDSAGEPTVASWTANFDKE